MILPNTKPITRKRLEQLKRNFGGARYTAWRNAVLQRDNNTCQYPGCDCKETLQIHHIRRFADAIHLRFDTINGITLCARHHHYIYGRERAYEMTFFRIAKANGSNSRY